MKSNVLFVLILLCSMSIIASSNSQPSLHNSIVSNDTLRHDLKVVVKNLLLSTQSKTQEEVVNNVLKPALLTVLEMHKNSTSDQADLYMRLQNEWGNISVREIQKAAKRENANKKVSSNGCCS